MDGENQKDLGSKDVKDADLFNHIRTNDDRENVKDADSFNHIRTDDDGEDVKDADSFNHIRTDDDGEDVKDADSFNHIRTDDDGNMYVKGFEEQMEFDPNVGVDAGETMTESEMSLQTNHTGENMYIYDYSFAPKMMLEAEELKERIADDKDESWEEELTNEPVYAQIDFQDSLTKDNAYECKVCKAVFNKPDQLKIHMKIHRGEKVFSCQFCSVVFTRASSLKVHLRIHTGEKPYKCEICNALFTHAGTYKTHLRTHTSERPYKCEFCNNTFTLSSTLKRHIRIHTGEKPYKCDICDTYFTYASSLKLHVRRHTGEKPYKCHLCDAGFVERGSLNSHLRTHTGEKPFKCELCGASFAQICSFKTHLRTHTGERPFKCNLCEAAFATKYTLSNHMWTHSRDKPYKCEICGAVFGQSGNLKNHLRTHTGEKPFLCQICNSSFARRSGLKTHMKTHEEKPRKKPGRKKKSEKEKASMNQMSEDHRKVTEDTKTDKKSSDALLMSSSTEPYKEYDNTSIDENFTKSLLASEGMVNVFSSSVRKKQTCASTITKGHWKKNRIMEESIGKATVPDVEGSDKEMPYHKIVNSFEKHKHSLLESTDFLWKNISVNHNANNIKEENQTNKPGNSISDVNNYEIESYMYQLLQNYMMDGRYRHLSLERNFPSNNINLTENESLTENHVNHKDENKTQTGLATKEFLERRQKSENKNITENHTNELQSYNEAEGNGDPIPNSDDNYSNMMLTFYRVNPLPQNPDFERP